ncbi:MAG: four helix bundle protein [Candidatus Cloacimonetes bacterium]|jgi:four helix bundle protein|nr:four helix bundle protein [Candidatus Cloacimonadota bacterium]
MKEKENNHKKFDLQERFIDYAVSIIKISEQLPVSRTGKHISSQLLRSGTSPAPNYGEAQSAESRADFIHKLKIALKEMRETEVWLKIIIKSKLIKSSATLSSLLHETDELISILFKSIDTAKKNNER